ncbi:MAG: YqgE/AlgH family protein [Chitinophagaceae bacterium]
MIAPAPGTILISDPFLKDPNFIRSVVFLCEHREEGSFGFVLNRPYVQTLDQLLPDLDGFPIPVYYGGPVQTDTLHFIHSLPGQIADGQEITDGIFWGGDFEQVLALIRDRTLNLDQVRFFLGYSGWSNGQLDGELEEKSWLTTNGNRQLVFHPQPEIAWKDAVRLLGPTYEEIINYPIDPQLN